MKVFYPDFFPYQLQDGEKVIIHYAGYQYIYQVREEFLTSASNIDAVFKHEEYQWLTLVTCDNFDKVMKKYLLRRVIRSVLISVIPEK